MGGSSGLLRICEAMKAGPVTSHSFVKVRYFQRRRIRSSQESLTGESRFGRAGGYWYSVAATRRVPRFRRRTVAPRLLWSLKMLLKFIYRDKSQAVLTTVGVLDDRNPGYCVSWNKRRGGVSEEFREFLVIKALLVTSGFVVRIPRV